MQRCVSSKSAMRMHAYVIINNMGAQIDSFIVVVVSAKQTHTHKDNNDSNNEERLIIWPNLM